MSEKDEIQNLIQKLSGITITSDLIPFNMLNVLYQDVYQKEKAHDKLFAGLLNPNKNHGFDELLLKEFLIMLEIEKNVIEDIKDVCVELNRKVRDRFIDIFISWKNKEEVKCAVIIENKLHGASDQKNQLNDYYYGIKDENFDVKKVVYMPFSKKWRSVENYPNLDGIIKNFSKDFDANDIVKWLKKCIEMAKKRNQNLGLLEQYKMFFECLIKENLIKMKATEILEALGKDNKNKIEEINRLESIAKIVNTEEWCEVRFKKITESLKKEYPILIDRYFSGNYAWFYHEESDDVWLSLWLWEKVISIEICSTNNKNKEDVILITDIAYKFDEKWSDGKYYYTRKQNRYFDYSKQDDLIKEALKILEELKSKRYSFK